MKKVQPKLILIIILLFTSLLYATPWWWAGFSKGNGSNSSNSKFELWHAYFIDSASASETVYLTTFTWATAGNIAPINGIGGDNSIGLNHISSSQGGSGRTTPMRILTDSSGSGWSYIQGILDSGIDTADDANSVAPAKTTHNKFIYISNEGFIISSANVSSGGYNSQHNNSVMLWYSEFSDLMNTKLEPKLNSLYNGHFHEQTNAGNNVYYSPYNDTVELYFTPDDNDNNSVPGSSSIAGHLGTYSQNATESILYCMNGITISDLADAINNNTLAYKAGATNGSFSGSVYSTLSANHTCRNDSRGFDRLHSKFIVFDMEIVATGSPNHTKTAMVYDGSGFDPNDESEIIIHDFRIARRYKDEVKREMSELGNNIGAGGDDWETTPPGMPTGLTVTPTQTNFGLSWTPPASPGDFSRYYIFISTSAINSQKDIGDGVDNDGDGYYDEDPVGNVDRLDDADDDYDGSTDEDPWLYPETEIRCDTPGSITSTVISTYNVGDSVVSGVNYWFAIVAVDTRGNESTLDTAGPEQLTQNNVNLNITKLGDYVSGNVYRADTQVELINLRIESDTSVDSISYFSIMNYGSASDGTDISKVELWEDDGDSVIGSNDTYIARLYWNTDRWETTGINYSMGDSLIYVIATIDVTQNADYNDTIQFYVPSNGVRSAAGATDPISAVSNANYKTIISTNPIIISKLGDIPANTIQKSEADVEVLNLDITANVGGDTFIYFRLKNNGTAANSTDITKVSIYEDDGDSIIEYPGDDTFIGNAVYNATSGYYETSVLYYSASGHIKALIGVDISANANGLATIQFGIPINGVESIIADTGPSTALNNAAIQTIASDTSPDTAILINEFMPDATGTGADPDHDNDAIITDGDEEFIELYNNSDGSVDLSGWFLDDDLSPGDITIPSGITLTARQFLIAYSDIDSENRNLYVYDSAGITIVDSGLWTGSWNGLNNTGDTLSVSNSSSTIIDSYVYTGSTGHQSYARLIDGWDTWGSAQDITPGINQDPTASFNTTSSNGYILVTLEDASIYRSDSAQLNMIIYSSLGDTVTDFGANGETVDIGITSTTISPTSTGIFSNGMRSDSFSIADTGTFTITVSYKTTTLGTVSITVIELTDDTAPDPISDLIADTSTSTTIELSWTAPGDDGTTGTASEYIIKYSTSGPITDTNSFNAGETVSVGVPTPSVAGTSETMTVTGLQSLTTYYFAIKTKDESNNLSDISNCDSEITLGYTITGNVQLEAGANDTGISVMLYNGTDTFTGYTDNSGTFTISNVKSGLYSVSTDELRHLKKVYTNLVTISSDTTITGLNTLVAGDADNDNYINIKDAALVEIYIFLGTTTDGTDIDHDGDTDWDDLNYVRQNFGGIGE